MTLLEPGSPDSLVGWGFFTAAFERKEYMEAYVAEDVAAAMLAKDPALRGRVREARRRRSGVREEPVGAARLLLPASPGVGRAPQPLPGLSHGERRAVGVDCLRSERTVRMRRVVPVVAVLLVAALAPLASISPAAGRRRSPSGSRLAWRAQPIDGRLLLLISTEKTGEPRLQIDAGPKTQQVFGIDVDGWRPGETQSIDADVLGYPRASPARRAGRRVPRPGAAAPLRDLPRAPTATSSSCRWIAAKGSSGTARRATCISTPATVRIDAGGGGHPGDARSGDPADRGSADDEVRPPRADPERAADEVLGPADVSSARTCSCRKASTRTRTRAIRW